MSSFSAKKPLKKKRKKEGKKRSDRDADVRRGGASLIGLHCRCERVAFGREDAAVISWGERYITRV